MNQKDANTIAAYLTEKNQEFKEGRTYWKNKLDTLKSEAAINEKQLNEAMSNYHYFNCLIQEISFMITNVELTPYLTTSKTF